MTLESITAGCIASEESWNQFLQKEKEDDITTTLRMQ